MDIFAAITALTQIVGYVKSAVSAWQSAESIVGQLSGKQSNAQKMMAVLNLMSQQLSQGLQAIVNAINDQTIRQQWEPFAQQLNDIQQTVAERMQELASIDSTTYQITVYGQSVDFATWATGTPAIPGALDDLGKQLDLLADMFESGGSANPSAIDLWSQVSIAAIPNSDPGFARETQYTLMFAFLCEIYSTVCQIFYVRENALALYYAHYAQPGTPYEPLAKSIAARFGDSTQPSTVWGQFAAALQRFASQPPGNDELSASVTGADSGQTTGPMTVDPFATYGLMDLTQTTVPSSQTNSCFAGLQLQQYIWSWNDRWLPVFYLQGLLVNVGAGATFTEGSWYTAFNSDALGSSVVLPPPNTALLGPADCHYIDLGYVTPPTTANNNISNVITGFRIGRLSTIGNRYGIGLQFGQLDLTDPARPTITVKDENFYFSEGGGYLTLVPRGDENPTMNVDVRPAATASPLPISNAAFALLPENPNRLGVRVQTAWSGYRATMFQPDQMLTATPSQPK